MSSSENPGVVDDGTTAPPAAAGAGEAESHLVGELARSGGLAVGDATLDLGHGGQVTGMDRHLLGQQTGGSGGQSQGEDYEHFHDGRRTNDSLPATPALLYQLIGRLIIGRASCILTKSLLFIRVKLLISRGFCSDFRFFFSFFY